MPIMPRVVLGVLVIAAFAASSAALNAALAVEAGSPPGAGSAPSGKPAKGTRPKRIAVPLSAYDTRSTELPVAPIHPRQPPPPQSSWTGIYVGVGTGAGN
jgi:hypothetical protein